MKNITCDITGQTIVGGMPNFGRGVHSILIDANQDISCNVTFLGTGRGAVTPQVLGDMWKQQTGGVNLSAAGLTAAFLAAKTPANIVTPIVSSIQSAATQSPAHICDLTGETIAVGTRNYGRGTATVNVYEGIRMDVSFYKGNSGGVDLSQNGFIAAMEAARLKAAAMGTTAATGTLTFTGVAIANETVTINGRVYTYKAALTGAANEVLIGANQTESAANLAAAINGTGGSGTTYGVGTVPHADVTAQNNAATVILTAKNNGTGANAFGTTETLTNGSWGAATLTGGTVATATGTVSANHIASGAPGFVATEAAGVSRPND
jgi:hypothetical protein